MSERMGFAAKVLKRERLRRLNRALTAASLFGVVAIAALGYWAMHHDKAKPESKFTAGTVQFTESMCCSPGWTETNSAFNRDGIPTQLHIEGEDWDVQKVDFFEDAMGHKAGDNISGKVAQTNCTAREISYIATPDKVSLRTSLWHEIFHAAACAHGGAKWWNSRYDNQNGLDGHRGIYRLGSFMAQFAKTNPSFMYWAADL